MVAAGAWEGALPGWGCACTAPSYRPTRLLPRSPQELCGGEGAAAASAASAAAPGSAQGGLPPLPRVRDMADVVCAEALEPYLALELRWLAGVYEARAGAAGRAGGLSMELLLDLLAANEEVGAGGWVGAAAGGVV